MKRKVLSMMLAVSMVAALSGCAGGSGSTSGSNTSDASSVSASSASDTTADSASASVSAESEAADSADVMTYDEYMTADLDTEVTIQAYVQAKQSWWEDEGQGKATVYAQDKNGAYFLYDMACAEEDYDLLTQGTKIQVTGYKSEWSGEVEIIDGSFEIIEGDEYIAPPLDVTNMLGTDDLINYQKQVGEC